MATYAYSLIGKNPDNNYCQVCDIGEPDQAFVEKGSYGSVPVLKRPKFLEALKVLRKGDTFTISSLSVLSIDPEPRPSEMLATLRTLQATGAYVVFVQEGWALSSSLGKQFLVTLRALAQLENTVRRIRL